MHENESNEQEIIDLKIGAKLGDKLNKMGENLEEYLDLPEFSDLMSFDAYTSNTDLLLAIMGPERFKPGLFNRHKCDEFEAICFVEPLLDGEHTLESPGELGVAWVRMFLISEVSDEIFQGMKHLLSSDVVDEREIKGKMMRCFITLIGHVKGGKGRILTMTNTLRDHAMRNMARGTKDDQD